MNAKTALLITACVSLFLLICALSAPPPWANYTVTIDGTDHYAASCHWSGDELSLVTAEKQIVTFNVGEGVTVKIVEIVREK